jgi:hypothetical protein
VINTCEKEQDLPRYEKQTIVFHEKNEDHKTTCCDGNFQYNGQHNPHERGYRPHE